jgi:hypothetical protein
MPKPWEKYKGGVKPWEKYQTSSDATATQTFNPVPEQPIEDIKPSLGRLMNFQNPYAMAMTNPQQIASDANLVLRTGLPLLASPLPPILRAPLTGALSGTASLVGNALMNVANKKNVPLGEQFQEAGKDALIGMGLQGAAEGASALAPKLAKGLYGSALKPSTTLSPAERSAVINTGLNKTKLAVSGGGYDKLQKNITDINDLISNQVMKAAVKGKTINTESVANRLDDVRKYFEDFAFPKQYMEKIDVLKNEFLEQHGKVIPVNKAQDIKKRTYQILKNAYGELGSASVESSKAIARGLKEELVNLPVLKNLNATDSELLRFEEELSRAVGRSGNYNLMKLGTSAGGALGYAVSGTPVGGKFGAVLTHLIDNPNIKSRLALLINKAQGLSKITVPIVNATEELVK